MKSSKSTQFRYGQVAIPSTFFLAERASAQNQDRSGLSVIDPIYAASLRNAVIVDIVVCRSVFRNLGVVGVVVSHEEKSGEEMPESWKGEEEEEEEEEEGKWERERERERE